MHLKYLGVLLACVSCAQSARFIKSYTKEDDMRGLMGIYGVAVSPDDRHVYTVADKGNSLTAAKRNTETGELEFLQSFTNAKIGGLGLQGARHVELTSTGSHLLVSACYDDSMAVFTRDAESGKLTFLKATQNATDLNGVWTFKISPDDRFVYTAGYEDNTIGVYSFDQATGEMVNLQPVHHRLEGEDYIPGFEHEFFEGLGGVRSLEISDDGRFLYAVSFDSMTMGVFPRDPQTGLLERQTQILENGKPLGMDGMDGAFHLKGSPLKGMPYIYLASWTWSQEKPQADSGKGFDSSVTVLKRDAETGHLTLVECLHDGVNGVNDLMGACALDVSQDGRWLVVVAMWEHTTVIFEIDQDDGTLMLDHIFKNGVEGVKDLGAPHGVKVSRDGKHAYVTATKSNAVAVFELSQVDEDEEHEL